MFSLDLAEFLELSSLGWHGGIADICVAVRVSRPLASVAIGPSLPHVDLQIHSAKIFSEASIGRLIAGMGITPAVEVQPIFHRHCLQLLGVFGALGVIRAPCKSLGWHINVHCLPNKMVGEMDAQACWRMAPQIQHECRSASSKAHITNLTSSDRARRSAADTDVQTAEKDRSRRI